MLACPVCQQALMLDQKTYRCPANHCFDMAKQGYTNLLLAQHKKSKDPGDNKDMVLARQAYLQAGHYQPILDGVISMLPSQPIEQLMDCGCGEGWYTRGLAQAIANQQSTAPQVYALDISRPAIQAAAKPKQANLHWLVASITRPPIQLNSLDLITVIFCRDDFVAWRPLLKEGGVIISVNPGQDHLQELRQMIYREPKAHDENAQLNRIDGELWQMETHRVKQVITLDQQALQNLLLMTPYYWSASEEVKQMLSEKTSMDLTIDVLVRRFSLTS